MDVLKRYDMPGREQLQSETNSWKKTISRLTTQNNDLKIQLSDALAAIFSPNLLQQAEDFQLRFLKTDICIDQLQTEVAALHKLLTKHNSKGDIMDGELLFVFHALRMKINEQEECFIRLKNEFYNYLMGIA